MYRGAIAVSSFTTRWMTFSGFSLRNSNAIVSSGAKHRVRNSWAFLWFIEKSPRCGGPALSRASAERKESGLGGHFLFFVLLFGACFRGPIELQNRVHPDLPDGLF